MTKTSSSTLDRQGLEASGDASGPRPPAGRPEGVRVAVFGGGLVLAGLGAAAVGSVVGEITASASTTAVRIALLVGGTVVAGLGLVRPLVGARVSSQSGPSHRRAAWTAGLLAAVAALAGYLLGDVGRTGTLLWVLAAVAVPILSSTRRSWPACVAALPAAGLVAVTLGSGHPGAAFVADVVYALAATVLVGVLVVRTLDPAHAASGDRAAPGNRAAPGAGTDGSTVHRAVADDVPAGAMPAGRADADEVAAEPQHTGSEPAAAPGRPDLLVRTALVGGSIAVLAGVARILTAGPFSPTDLVGTAYGRTALLAVALPALALAVLAAGHVRGGPSPRVATRAWGATAGDGSPRRDLRAAAAGAVVVGVAAASVAGLVPAPAPAAVPGQALLRTVALDGATVPILIAPMRPGPNLVQIGGSGYPTAGGRVVAQAAGTDPGPDGAVTGGAVTGGAVTGGAIPDGVASSGAVHGGADHGGADHGGAEHGVGHDMADHGGRATVETGGDPAPFVSRAGARGGWAVVDIPAGSGSVTVRMGGDSVTVPVSVDGTGSPSTGSVASALVGRDGPECASAIVGAALAGGPEAGAVGSCPAQGLDPEQASALRSTVAHMAQKGARSVRVVSDPSPRSVAAARLVRDEGARVGLAFPPDAVNDPNSAVVVVSGWEQAVATLGEDGVRARTTPTHLGGTFLAPWLLTGDVLRQTASAFLPLPFAPNEPDGRRYALALAATYPDTAPSTSGFLAWARATGVGTDDRPSLYGAAAVSVPMSIEPPGSTGHHGGPNPAAWFPGGTVVPVTGPLEGS